MGRVSRTRVTRHSYTPVSLIAERYGPSAWWETKPPTPVLPPDDVPTLDGVDRCVRCKSQVPSNEPCPKCARQVRQ